MYPEKHSRLHGLILAVVLLMPSALSANAHCACDISSDFKLDQARSRFGICTASLNYYDPNYLDYVYYDLPDIDRLRRI